MTVAEHELLLRATLGPDDLAHDAYERWRAQTDLATVDRASQRVLALLSERLGERRDDEVAAKVRRIARFTWLRTQVLLERTAPAVRGLTEAGVPVLLIKGGAVLAHTEWKVARRPMDDLDIAVPRAHATRAIAALVATGFQPWFIPTRAHLDEHHAMEFRDAAGAQLDLHWHVLHGSLHPDADADFWAAAQPAALRDVPCSVLCREDTLLQAVTQGREYSETHPLRWAADAAELLRGAPAFDWERVAEQARRHRLTRELRDALAVLTDVTGEPVPAAAGRPRGRPRRSKQSRRDRPRTGAPIARLEGSGGGSPNERPEGSPRTGARRPEESRGDGPLTPTTRERVGDELASWVRREVAPGAPLRPRHAALWLKETWALPHARVVPKHALWLASGRRAAPSPDPTPETAVALAPGATLRFQYAQPGTGNLGAGWWAPDLYGAWSRGREAVLVLPLHPRHDGPLTLTLEVSPFVTPTRPHLAVDVALDGTPHARWGFSGTGAVPEQRVIEVPARAGRARIALRFAIRHPLSPLAARYGSDPRPLGFALLSAEVSCS